MPFELFYVKIIIILILDPVAVHSFFNLFSRWLIQGMGDGGSVQNGDARRHIRYILSRSDAEKIVHAFVTLRLDNCNSLL